MSILGRRLKELREKMKKTQRDVSEDLNISNVVLSRYESGDRKPDPETLSNFVEYYKTSADYLLGLIDDPTPLAEHESIHGRAYYGGGDDWTEEEKLLADSFIKTIRERKRVEQKKKKDEE